MHQTPLCELSNEVDVDGAPGAAGLPGSKTNGVAGFVEAFANAVDPAEAQGDFYGFGPSDAGLARIFFVAAHELLAEHVMMGFEPAAELCRCREECWFWRHGSGQYCVSEKGSATT